MDVNKYRHLCRLQIAGCPELSPAHKVVLMTLTDYINRKTFIAWPDFDTLAENCDVDRRTAIRAINEGRRLWHIVRIRRGGKVAGRGISNQYVFRLKHVPDAPKIMSRDREIVSRQSLISVTLDTLTSDEHLILFQRGYDLASYASSSEDRKADEKRLGEEERETPRSPDPPKASVKAECFRLAREYEGDGSCGLVARLLNNGESPEDVLADIRDAIESGNCLGHALWRPE